MTLWLVSLIFILLKGDLLNLGAFSYVDLDLVTVITAYLLIYCDQTAGGIFALSQGFLIDALSASHFGFFVLLYLGAFLSINVGFRFFDSQSPRGQIIMITLTVLVKELLLLAMLKAFSQEILISSHFFWTTITAALCSGIFAPIFFFFLNQVHQFFMKEKKESLIV